MFLFLLFFFSGLNKKQYLSWQYEKHCSSIQHWNLNSFVYGSGQDPMVALYIKQRSDDQNKG